jgi:hypothetical protein
MSDLLDAPSRPAQPGDLTGRRMERHSPLLEEAWRYWSSLRSGGALPERRTLEPRAMGLILGHSMILERGRPGLIRVRVGGSVLSRLMGMEVRGLPLRAFFAVAQRAEVTETVDRVFSDPATLEMRLAAVDATGPISARMLVLPLRDGAGGVDKALACLAVDRVDPAPPHRFTLERSFLSPLAPPARPPRRAEASQTPRRAHLRVVK